MDGCPQADKFANIGKEGYSTKVYMVAGDACKMVHHVHGSHPGGRNNLTMAHYDEYLQAMRKGLYADQEFDMYSGEGTDTFRESGLSALTDNGFHEWLETQYPSKLSRETSPRRPHCAVLNSPRDQVEQGVSQTKLEFELSARIPYVWS